MRVVGIPVAHGIEMFRNRTRELDAIVACLNDPTIRMVTITGRRGIGKSALAAKIMDLLDRGEWPGPAQGQPPSGLVNLSTRTSGISLERLYFSCASLLGPEKEAHLRKTWDSHTKTPDRLAELHAAIGERLIVILMDNLEDLLHDDGSIADEELAITLDWLFRARTTPRLLVTSQLPVRLAPELRRFASQVELTEGLSPTESADLLRELDRDGSLGIAELSDDELLKAAVRLHGVPRALELLVGAVADDTLLLPTLKDVLEDFTRRNDVVAHLAQDRYQRLDGSARAVLGVLAALRTPIERNVVEEIVAGLDPDLPVIPVLTSLVRVYLVSLDRASHTFALHPMDADLAYAQMPQHGPFARQPVERQIASWYAYQARPRGTWRTLEDIEPHRRQFDHLVRAGDHDPAAQVLSEISEWLVWHGSVLTAVSMHLTVDGHIGDERVRLAHAVAYGHARLSAGPMEQAVELFTQAAALAERLDDRPTLQRALFGLGDAHRQLGDQDATLEPLTQAAELAHELGDTEHEVHALLSQPRPQLPRRRPERAGRRPPPRRTRRCERRPAHDRPRRQRAHHRPAHLAPLAGDCPRGRRNSTRLPRRQQPGSDRLRTERAGHRLAGPRRPGASSLSPRRSPPRGLTHGKSPGRGRLPAQPLLGVLVRRPPQRVRQHSRTCLDRSPIAGATEAAAAQSLIEAARALPTTSQTAAAALTRAAEALHLHPNAEVINPAWLTKRARRLTD